MPSDLALANRATNFELGPLILRLRDDENLSWRRISLRLHDDLDLDFAPNTVRSWYLELKATAA